MPDTPTVTPLPGALLALVTVHLGDGFLVLTCSEEDFPGGGNWHISAALDRDRAAYLAELLATFARTGALPVIEAEGDARGE